MWGETEGEGWGQGWEFPVQTEWCLIGLLVTFDPEKKRKIVKPG